MTKRKNLISRLWQKKEEKRYFISRSRSVIMKGKRNIFLIYTICMLSFLFLINLIYTSISFGQLITPCWWGMFIWLGLNIICILIFLYAATRDYIRE